jgi:tRNA (guanine37-N1)-methyltransferase
VTFHILTLFPEIFEGYASASILGKAMERGLVSLHLVDIRDFATDRHRTCDDAPYGGGAGMVLKPEPLAAALESIPAVRSLGGGPPAVGPSGLSGPAAGSRVVFLTPSGRVWNQGMAESLALAEETVLICGRYEGVDQRVVDMYATDEISVGDYVLSGGEVAAMVLVDTVVRLVPGVIKEQSLAEESLGRGLLEYPQYTRPPVFRGREVPEVLMSGNHAEIRRWRFEQSRRKTRALRPDLLEGRGREQGSKEPPGAGWQSGAGG